MNTMFSNGESIGYVSENIDNLNVETEVKVKLIAAFTDLVGRFQGDFEKMTCPGNFFGACRRTGADPKLLVDCISNGVRKAWKEG